MAATPLYQVRLIIADMGEGEDQLLDDTQLDAFLELAGGNVRLAAADALEAIAVSEVLVGKKIRTQDLATDGAAVSAELRRLAQQQRDLAAQEADEDAWDGFDVVDTVPSRRRPEATSDYTECWGL